MKTFLPIIGLSALAAATAQAEPPAAPKLVPRPLPGLGVVQPLPSGEEEKVAPIAEKPLLDAPERSAPPVDPEAANRARVLFIHRRATLPPSMTADLAKPEAPAPQANASAFIQARPGKIRIIPKSEVATMLAAPAPPKPDTEP